MINDMFSTRVQCCDASADMFPRIRCSEAIDDHSADHGDCDGALTRDGVPAEVLAVLLGV